MEKAINPHPAVEIHDLTVAYREAPVLWDIDLTIPAGSLTAIIGPNGAGKSTLMKSMLNLVPTAAGTILVDGRPYRSTATHRRLCSTARQR